MNPDGNSQWQYKPDNGAALVTAPLAGSPTAETKPRSQGSVNWEAPEFIEHHHGAIWYLLLILVTAALAAIVYLVAKDYIATGTIVVLGLIVGVFAGHKPNRAKYEINSSGLSVNSKTYRYSDYKSFTVIREGSLSSLNLLPLKRFMPPLTVYFEPAEEQKIIDALGDYLPYEERRLDAIDRLSRRLRL